MIVQIKAYCEPVLIIFSKLAWTHNIFTHVFVKLDQSANTRIPQWPAYYKKNSSIQGKIELAILNYQADSPLLCVVTRLMSDLVICNFRKSMFIHDTEWPVWYHRTTQTQPTHSS